MKKTVGSWPSMTDLTRMSNKKILSEFYPSDLPHHASLGQKSEMDHEVRKLIETLKYSPYPDNWTISQEEFDGLNLEFLTSTFVPGHGTLTTGRAGKPSEQYIRKNDDGSYSVTGLFVYSVLSMNYYNRGTKLNINTIINDQITHSFNTPQETIKITSQEDLNNLEGTNLNLEIVGEIDSLAINNGSFHSLVVNGKVDHLEIGGNTAIRKCIIKEGTSINKLDFTSNSKYTKYLFTEKDSKIKNFWAEMDSSIKRIKFSHNTIIKSMAIEFQAGNKELLIENEKGEWIDKTD